MSQDVWQGSETGGRGEGVEGLAHGDGWAKKRSFGYETVLYGGIGIIKEQPAAVLLWTVFFFFMSFTASCLTSPLTVGVNIYTETAGLDASVAMAINQVVTQSCTMLVSVPIQQFCMAGLIAFVAHYIRTDEADLPLLFTNVWGGIRGTLVTWSITALYMLLLIPLGAVAAGTFYATEDLQMTIMAFGAAYVLLIPVMLFLLPLSLALYAAILDEVGPLEAIATAWTAGSGARVEIFVMLLVMGLLTVVLMLMCCLPAVIAPSLFSAGLAVAWLTYSRDEAEVDSWQFIQRNFE